MSLTFQKYTRKLKQSRARIFSIPKKMKKWPKNTAGQVYQIRQIAHVQVERTRQLLHSTKEMKSILQLQEGKAEEVSVSYKKSKRRCVMLYIY